MVFLSQLTEASWQERPPVMDGYMRGMDKIGSKEDWILTEGIRRGAGVCLSQLTEASWQLSNGMGEPTVAMSGIRMDGSSWVKEIGYWQGQLRSGRSALSHDGSIVAIGARDNDGNGTKGCAVYSWDGSLGPKRMDLMERQQATATGEVHLGTGNRSSGATDWYGTPLASEGLRVLCSC